MTIIIEQPQFDAAVEGKVPGDPGELVLDGGFTVPDSNAFGHTFRDYDAESERKKTVEEFYRVNHISQTYEFVRRMRDAYARLDRTEMSIWECIELLNEFIDDSDPDLDMPQIEHLLQTAEAIRKDYPDEDWLHLTGLIHVVAAKSWAPGKTKFLFWLLLQNRLGCNDRLQRRGWKNGYFCPMCMRNLETSVHLFWECPVSKEIWRRISNWPGCGKLALLASADDSTASDQRMRNLLQQSRPNLKAKLKTMMFLVTWHIWTERNNRTFRHTRNQVNGVITAIRCDMDWWRIASAKCLETPLGDPG